MPVQADVVAYIDAQTALTAGTNLFEGPLPGESTQDPLVSVLHFMSRPSDDYTMGASLTAPGSEIESVKVMVRSANQATAKTQADAIHALLDNLQNTSLSGRTYFHVTSDGPPWLEAQDNNNRFRFVGQYHCRKTRG